ncbi:MAG: secretion protein HlyD, partial [Armatimonadota bacterium]
LLAEGRTVRLQLAGWPALQFSGWPSVAVGTFAGKVSVIDAVDDGTARYRVIVRPDRERIASGKDQPWPPADTLRPGAEATGWILLDTVSLGFELWRQFNAFPPTVKRVPNKNKESSKEDSDKEKKESPYLKIKQPK